MNLMSSGIYRITNTAKGRKSYIGSSVNMEKRWIDHRSRLRRGTHYNLHLQNAWGKYGEAVFEFAVVEWVPVEGLKSREEFWIKQTMSHLRDFGYNLSQDTQAPTRGTKRPDVGKKISATLKGRKKGPMSKTHRLALSKAHAGKSHSKEWNASVSVAKKGIDVLSPEARQRQAASLRGRSGHKHTEEFKQAQREKALQRRRVNGKFV
jgi:group I intron endonuclease